MPDGGRNREDDRRHNHRAGAAHQFEQRQQKKAADGGTGEVEEVDSVDLPNGFANGERDNRAGSEER